MDNLITLTEWANLNGISPATARQRAGRGAFETTVKIGRDWFIDKNEPLIDNRAGGRSRRWKKEENENE